MSVIHYHIVGATFAVAQGQRKADPYRDIPTILSVVALAVGSLPLCGGWLRRRGRIRHRGGLSGGWCLHRWLLASWQELKHFSSTNGANALRRRATVLHRHNRYVAHNTFCLAFHAIGLNLVSHGNSSLGCKLNFVAYVQK